MIIYEYIINIITWISNPWGYGKWTTIETMMNDVNVENIYKKKLKKAIKIIEIKKNDYVSLKDTSEKLTQAYKELSKVITKKDMEIDALKGLIDKYEESFLKFETDKKAMVDILDSYKNNLQKLLDWKAQAIKTMDAQSVEISRLKKMNLKLLVELKTYKKD